MSKFRSAYAAIIAEATGEKEPEALAEIEEHMRHTIFHSTLDWQTRRQLRDGARKAYQVYVAMKGDDATDEQVARAFKTFLIKGDEAASIRALRAQFKKAIAA